MAREKNIPEEHDPSLGPAVHAVHVGGESILDRLLPHAKKIGLALAGAAVIVAAVFTYRYFQHRKAERATVRVAKALDLVDRPIFNPDPTVPQPPLDQQVFKSETERNEAVMTALGKLGPTRGSVALVEAQTLLRAGKLDAALALYRKRASARGFDGLVAREGVGIVLEAQASAATDPAQKQKLLEEALAAFRAIQPDEQACVATTRSTTRAASSRRWASRSRPPPPSRRRSRCPTRCSSRRSRPGCRRSASSRRRRPRRST